MTNEKWCAIPEYEGFYSVSNHGRIRSEVRSIRMGNGSALHPVGGRILKPAASRTGYLMVDLCRNGDRQRLLVHRLVLETFIGQAPEGLEGCHFDGDKTNNHLSNLRWDTRSANQEDVIRVGNNHQVNKTHCPQGHPYNIENTYVRPDRNGRTHRGCRKCRSAAAARSKQRRGRVA